ncbi:hypothetical protein FRC03_006059 [Tulasnella sp. 419]|nr:hypothetical protein FRC03_006059 [Tulasnella sp. 419]
MVSLVHYLWVLWLMTSRAGATTYLNTTVDDCSPDVTYSPLNAWAKKSSCDGGCPTSFDPSSLFANTWHEAIRGQYFPPYNITLKFCGVAVYVYGVFWDAAGSSRIDLQFELDNGFKTGSFSRESESLPEGEGRFTYDQVMYTINGLTDGEHSLLINMNRNSWFMFDRVVVTQSENSRTSTTPARSTSNSAAIIGGGVAVGVVGIAVGAITAYLLLRRRRARSRVQLLPDQSSVFNSQPEFPDRVHSRDQRPQMLQLEHSRYGNTLPISPEFIPPATYSNKSPYPLAAERRPINPFNDLPPRYEEYPR